jgi:hypothetical protein
MRNKRRIWKSPILQRDRQNMLLRRQILYTVTPTTKPHYCGGEYSRNPRDQRERKKTKRSSPSHLFANSIKTHHYYSWLAVAQKHGEKGKKGDKVPREVQAATREQLGSVPVEVRGKRSGIHIQWKVEIPEVSRLWDMRYLGLVWRS